jgi:hypothetical protein
VRDGGREGCLRVLGLGPGASEQEIKAAYRDLAKVWHPDRFSHDPRLQQKAQEQLKEINEAYRRLISNDHPPPAARARRDPHAAHHQHTPRAADAPPREPRPAAAHDSPQDAHVAATADERVATRPRRSVNRIAVAAPALAFCATFAFVTPRLLSTGRAPEQSGGAATAVSPARDEHGEASGQPADSDAEAAETKDVRAQQKNQTNIQQHPNEAANSATATAAAPQPVRPMPTVTVSIDPTTGLRARPGCPHKTAMTFPAGDEPAAYCDAAHNTAQPQRAATDDARAGKTDDARGKSFAGRFTSPVKKLVGGGSSDKESARDRNAPRN